MHPVSKFFSRIPAGVWLVLLLGVVAALWVADYQHTKAKYQEAVAENVKKDGVIADQADTIVTDQKVDALQEDVQRETAMAVRATTKTHETQQRVTEQQRQTVEQRFEVLPVTYDNAEKKQQELSNININALWGAYCRVKPEDPQCPNPSSP